MDSSCLGDLLAIAPDSDASILVIEPAWASCTRIELNLRARQIAGGLARIARPGERVLVSLPPGPDFFAAFFACLHAGLIPVPAAAPTGARRLARLQRIVAACEASRILCAEQLAAGAAVALGIPADTPDAFAAGDPVAPIRPAADSVAYLQFTSGSTATPRGVKITHAAALANIAAIRQRFQQGLEGPLVSWLPLNHDMGLVLSLTAIAAGVDVVLLSPDTFTRRPWAWLEAISDYGAAMSGGPNFAYELLCRTAVPADAKPIDLSGWKVALCGSEPVRQPVMARFAQRFAAAGLAPGALTPAYGLAEFTLFATTIPAGDPIQGRPVPDDPARVVCEVGIPPPGHRMLVVDPETRQPLPQGRIGEILLGGPSKAAGYWGDAADDTFETQVPGETSTFLRTGDLGFVEQGRLHIVGRAKELLVVRGRKLAPEEVERAVRTAHPALRGFASAYALDDDAGFGLLCEVEFGARRSALEPLVDAVQRELARSFGATARQIGLMRTGTIARTSSGKPLRGQYARMIETGDLRPLLLWSATALPTSPPRFADAPNAADVRGWIGDYLALRIGIDPASLRDGDLLQDLGLDSMGAVELSQALEDWLRCPIEPTVIWRADSLGELCAFLAGDRQRGRDAADPGDGGDLEHALRAIEGLRDDEVTARYTEHLLRKTG